MTQFDLDTPINPATKSGSVLASDLSAWRDAVHTSHSDTSRPSYVQAGTTWVNNSATPWVVYMFDGTDDIAIGTVNATTNKFIPGATAAAVFADIKQTATTIATGVAELATDGEALAGVETDRICTPAGLASNQTLASDGYTELPGGLIIQWGQSSVVGSTGFVAVSFPLTFPNNVWAVNSTPASGLNAGGGQSDFWGTRLHTLTGFEQRTAYDGNHDFTWMAIGN